MPFQGNALLFPLMARRRPRDHGVLLREARDGFHWWKTCLAPILGAGAISFAFYLMMKNRAGITFGAYEGWVKDVPLIALGHLPRRLSLALIYSGARRSGTRRSASSSTRKRERRAIAPTSTWAAPLRGRPGVGAGSCCVRRRWR